MTSHLSAEKEYTDLVDSSDEHTKDSEIQIDGYDIYRDDRNTSGGGVAVYVNQTVRHFHRSDIFLFY